MPFGWQVSDIAVPVKQIERGIVFTQQIVFHDGRPYEVFASKQIEAQRQKSAVDISLRRGKRLDHLDLVIVDEIQQLAATCEIDLRGKESCTFNFRGFALSRQNC